MDSTVFFLILVLPIVGGLVLYLIINQAVRVPGQLLGSRFRTLGDLKGMTIDEISARVQARPKALSSMPDGTLAQWMAAGYHIAILFDADGQCVAVTHESQT
jgi:hypothetical protein